MVCSINNGLLSISLIYLLEATGLFNREWIEFKCLLGCWKIKDDSETVNRN